MEWFSRKDAAIFEAFRGKMNDLGYVEGKNLSHRSKVCRRAI